MSATWIAAHPSPIHNFYSAIICDGVIMLEGGRDLVDEVVRQHNAFDALLAVAKTAKANGGHCCGEADTEETREALHAALRHLDAAHPDWRTW